MFCVLAVQVGVDGVDKLKIMTSDAVFSFDTASPSLILDGFTVCLELCNNSGFATDKALLCCFMVFEMMVVCMIAIFQCYRTFLTHGVGYVSAANSPSRFIDSA